MKSVIQISSKKGELQGSREDHPESNLRPNRTTPAQVSFFFLMIGWLSGRRGRIVGVRLAARARLVTHPLGNLIHHWGS